MILDRLMIVIRLVVIDMLSIYDIKKFMKAVNRLKQNLNLMESFLLGYMGML